jgi:nucleotide-binding universal stress UspA family protein
VLSGSPFLVIGDAARPGDVIVMASHGRGGARRWFLGSVAEKLIREAPVPVVIVPTRDRQVERDTAEDAALTASTAT